jgi:formimidoylglutamate deiminase
MPDLFFSSALLPDGWARDVRVAVDRDGHVASVTPKAVNNGGPAVPGVAVPGVPDLHSHSFQRALAGLAERGGAPGGDTFWTWRERMYRFLRHLTPEDCAAIAAQLAVELLRHGFTRIAEFHYLRNDSSGEPYVDPVEIARSVSSAALDVGIGVTLLPTLYRGSDFGRARPDAGQQRFAVTTEDLLGDVALLQKALAGEPSARVGLALHSLRAVPPHDLLRAVHALDGLDGSAPIHIHVAEQEREVEACLSWSGARPVEWLLDNAPVGPRWCLVHATHMTTQEATALARSGAVAGLCPTTEANLGDGLFPFDEYREAGGAWGVGTDSHVSVSPVAELRLLEYGQRLRLRRRNVGAGALPRSTGRALLEAAWAGGGRACGAPLGRIEVGQRADIVVLDPQHPALAGRTGDDVLDSWIFTGEDTPVRDVYVGGRLVVEEGRHPRQGEIADVYRTVAARLARS